MAGPNQTQPSKTPRNHSNKFQEHVAIINANPSVVRLHETLIKANSDVDKIG